MIGWDHEAALEHYKAATPSPKVQYLSDRCHVGRPNEVQGPRYPKVPVNYNTICACIGVDPLKFRRYQTDHIDFR